MPVHLGGAGHYGTQRHGGPVPQAVRAVRVRAIRVQVVLGVNMTPGAPEAHRTLRELITDDAPASEARSRAVRIRLKVGVSDEREPSAAAGASLRVGNRLPIGIGQ